MRLWLKLHKFMMGWAVLKHCCWWKRKWMSAPARAQSKISDDELFGEWQRLHYLFIWPLYNIVNCDVLKWIQTRGSVMRTYWISVRGRLNPPGSLTAHLSPSLASALVAQWHHSTHVSWPFEGHRSRLRDDVEFTFEKHEVRTSKQLSRCAPTPIKLDFTGEILYIFLSLHFYHNIHHVFRNKMLYLNQLNVIWTNPF